MLYAVRRDDGLHFFFHYIFAFIRAKVTYPPITSSSDKSLHGNFSEISTLFKVVFAKTFRCVTCL